MPTSPTLEKGVLRAPESITIPVHEFKGQATKPTRPAYKRSSMSHVRHRSSGPFTDVRRAWRKLLSNAPSLPTTRVNTEVLARNTYATAVGVCEGFRVPGYLFGWEQTDAFAQELARALNTEGLVFIIHRQTLYVVNEASITSNAANALQAAIFVHVSSNGESPEVVQGQSMPALLHGLNILLDLTSTTKTRVIEAADLVDSENDDLMDTLGDVLLGSPVAFCGASRQQVEGAMVSEPCWTVSVGFEGFDPAHDHKVPLCSLPTSLFNEQNIDSLDHSSITSPSVSSICDAKQTQYFQRLNASSMAADVWGEVSINVEGPGPYCSPVSSPTSP